MTRHPHDLPFEQSGGDPVEVDLSGHLAASVVVLASTTETVLGRFPALVFRFYDGHRQPFPDVVLLLDPEQAEKLPALVTAATAAAVRAVRR